MWRKTRVASFALAALLSASVAGAQSLGDFGRQARADAASQLITLSVQQGISTLPPTSGQSFVYELDPALDTYVRSDWLEPVSFRSPETIGANRVAIRVSGTYFDASDTYKPVVYGVSAVGPNPLPGCTVGGGFCAGTSFGLGASARVGLINVSTTYGITDVLELTLNVPISIVDASASDVYLQRYEDAPFPSERGSIGGAPVGPNATAQGVKDTVNRFVDAGSLGVIGTSFDRLNRLGSPSQFNSGTHAGIGRISLGVKGTFFETDKIVAAGSLEVFLPSPSEDEFAGTESGAFLPRAILKAMPFEGAGKSIAFLMDLGYDLDTEFDELRRFVWNVGGAYYFRRLTLDAGVGGSKFNQGIEYTPKRLTGGDNDSLEGIRLEGASVGSNFVDFLGGVKVALSDEIVVSGSVNVPLTDDGLRPDAVGTVAFEVYF